MSDAPWYHSFFGDDYLRNYASILTADRTEQELNGIVNLLDLPPGSAILDLPCGHGRHSIGLAQAGYRVTGQDLSEVFLKKARADARRAGVEVRWVHGDMRQIPFQNEFDAAINIFSAFGYFDDETEDMRALQAFRQALKPGGLFLMELMHRDNLLTRLMPSEIDEHEDGRLVLHERRFDLIGSRIEDQVTIIDPDETRHRYFTSLRLYTVRELVRMFAETGFRIEGVFGGLDGSELRLQSHRMAILSRNA
ncbi:MAG: methyltransferase domain-containing protein [Caldilineales bacterium]|nr:methyltransferase domain-containing protein [Caldilineales bacterium]